MSAFGAFSSLGNHIIAFAEQNHNVAQRFLPLRSLHLRGEVNSSAMRNYGRGASLSARQIFTFPFGEGGPPLLRWWMRCSRFPFRSAKKRSSCRAGPCVPPLLPFPLGIPPLASLVQRGEIYPQDFSLWTACGGGIVTVFHSNRHK